MFWNLEDLQKLNMISLQMVNIKNKNSKTIETQARNNERLIFIFTFHSVIYISYICRIRTIGIFCNNIDLDKERALWTAN